MYTTVALPVSPPFTPWYAVPESAVPVANWLTAAIFEIDEIISGLFVIYVVFGLAAVVSAWLLVFVIL